jgi:hypothetical protein
MGRAVAYALVGLLAGPVLGIGVACALFLLAIPVMAFYPDSVSGVAAGAICFGGPYLLFYALAGALHGWHKGLEADRREQSEGPRS